jgi:hypothetical protein
MTQSVIHQPRVAWDAACAFVRAAAGPDYQAFADRVSEQLGAEMHGDLGETRRLLLDAAAAQPGDQFRSHVESGKWRVRLEELMRDRPDLIGTLRDLTR